MIKKLTRWIPFIGGASDPVVPVVRITGPIGSSGRFGQGVTLAGIADTLEKAFSVKGAAAVALAINSPGGSPVQSDLIYRRVRALAEEKKLPVYAFAEDAAASGGYFIALAADEIFADDASIIGSIGVVSAGFGLTGLIERFGIERRVYTAGTNKGMLDPFLPEKREDVERLKAIQAKLHEVFKDRVRTSRGARLAEGQDDLLFSGAFWIASEAVDLGLIDGVGDIRSVMRARFGDKAALKPIGGARGLFPRRPQPGVAARAAWLDEQGPAPALIDAETALAVVETRGLWARLGL